MLAPSQPVSSLTIFALTVSRGPESGTGEGAPAAQFSHAGQGGGWGGGPKKRRVKPRRSWTQLNILAMPARYQDVSVPIYI